MPDIREILNALDPADRLIWSQHRTEMRRSYLAAHVNTVGVVKWDMHDDAFLDLMDIKLALLFDRAGRFETVKEIIGNDAERIEADIAKATIDIKADGPITVVPDAANSNAKLTQNQWAVN